MAEYEPFPTGSGEVESSSSMIGKLLGCLGCGGLSVVAGIAALAFLVAGLGTGTSGCDITLDGDPGQGTASEHLPVRVAPSTDLAPGDTVHVTSDAFDKKVVVGVAVCLRTADTLRRGVNVCDETQGYRYATDKDGKLDATYAVPRVITVRGRPFDCAKTARRCIVVAADGSNYDRSGGQPITFRPGLPTGSLTVLANRPVSDHLPIAASPAGPVRAGTDLTVLASGFQPGEPLLVAWCTNRLDDIGVERACQPDDPGDAVNAIVLRSMAHIVLHANAKGGVATTVEACGSIAPFGDDLSKALGQYGATDHGCRQPSDPGPVACDTEPGRCSIVIAAAADTKRSAVLPYTLAG